MITGVSNFSNVSLFSSLNNLNDITLDPRYSSLCGYTDRDLDTVFASEVDGLDRDTIRQWYKGYTWGGDERLYNPFDILWLFDKRDFDGYWFETGTPKFLPETLVRRGVSTLKLEGLQADKGLLSTFDIDHVATEALLFQTGYLTVAEVQRDGLGRRSYRLDYPNCEVRVSLNRTLLSSLVDGLSEGRLKHCNDVAEHIRSADFKAMEQSLRAFFATIPHAWYRNNEIQRYEGYYASVFFAMLSGFGLDVRLEEASSQGNLDLAVIAPERIALIEFKTVQEDQDSGRAVKQIEEKDSARKHLGGGKPVHLVGVEFGIEARNLSLVHWETAGTEKAGTADSPAPAFQRETGLRARAEAANLSFTS